MSKFWKKSRSIPVAVNVSVEEDTYISQGREYGHGSVRQQRHGLQQQQPTLPIRSSTSLSDSDSSSSVQRPEEAHTGSSGPTNPVLANIHRQTNAAPIPVKLPSKSRRGSRSQTRSRSTPNTRTQPIQNHNQDQRQRGEQGRGNGRRPEHKRESSDPKVEPQHDIEAYGVVPVLDSGLSPSPFSSPQSMNTSTSTSQKLKGLSWLFPPKSSGAGWIRRYIFLIIFIITIVVGLLVAGIVLARVFRPKQRQSMWDVV